MSPKVIGPRSRSQRKIAFLAYFSHFRELLPHFSSDKAKNAQACAEWPYAETYESGIFSFCPQGQIFKVKGQTFDASFNPLNDCIGLSYSPGRKA